MKSIMMAVGGIGAGLYLMLKDFLPWLLARQTGTIRTRGYRAQIVRRDENPERFHGLSRQRLQGAGTGAMLLIGGLAAFAFWIASLLSLTAA